MYKFYDSKKRDPLSQKNARIIRLEKELKYLWKQAAYQSVINQMVHLSSPFSLPPSAYDTSVSQRINHLERELAEERISMRRTANESVIPDSAVKCLS